MPREPDWGHQSRSIRYPKSYWYHEARVVPGEPYPPGMYTNLVMEDIAFEQRLAHSTPAHPVMPVTYIRHTPRKYPIGMACPQCRRVEKIVNGICKTCYSRQLKRHVVERRARIQAYLADMKKS